MTIEEAIKRAEDTAIGADELCKRYDRASGYSRSHDETIRTNDAKMFEKSAQEHRQLAEWLKDYKRLLESGSEKPNKSEIPTGSDDCISRQDVLSEIIRFSTEEGSSVECQQLYCDVNNMPSVTPQEPRQGHWKFQKITQGKRMWCSHCNSVFDLCCSQIKRYNEATRDNDIWAYCPWCGARMIESQESEG